MSDDDEDYASFGTPLEPLEEDVVQAKKAPRLEDQVALDKQGRRRFHGAFSGGFSAGYFNSAGTKEGWTPQTFVSSRGERAEKKKFQPHDFMDDEDLSEHGIAPQRIRTTSSYDSLGDKKRKRVFDPSGPIPGVPVLEEILRPSRETMGMKLLRHLGWKPGQGIGPRVSHKHTKKSRNRIRGCQGPPGSKHAIDDSDDDVHNMQDYMPDVTFAPEDVDTLDLSTPKSDQFGLGYTPLDRTSVLGHINLFDANPLSITEKKKKLLIKGQAFGVGAFEEEDEDIYATEDMSNYDFSGDDVNKKQNRKESDKYHQAIMDLSDRVEGFKLSSQPLQTLKNYPLPKLPKDFVPHHRSRRLRFERRESDVRGLGRHDLTRQQRADMINERPKAKVEVRSGLKQEPIDSLSSQSSSERSLSEADAEIEKLYEEFKNSGSKPLAEYKPFAKDPEKQRRYELYLRMKAAGHKDRFHLALPRSMREWEKEREIREFYRAAQLFQPLTSTMASRFITAATDDKVPILKDGLNVDIPKIVEEAKIDCETDALGGSVKDDRIKAAKMKMFGKLTQYTDDWYPENLVCRRFNIPNPYPGSSLVGVPKGRKEKFSLFNSLNAPIETTAGLQSLKEKEDEKIDKNEEEELSKDLSIDNQDLDESKENYGLKVPVDGPPTMDLFKAIFQDSDSDSDSNDSDKEENNKVDKDKQNKSTEKGQKSEDNSKKVDDFLSAMRNHDNNSESSSECDSTEGWKNRNIDNSKSDHCDSKLENVHRGPRMSRFDRTDRPNLDHSENVLKPVFVSRKKELPKDTEKSVSTAKGIFANIDFEEINSYRDYQPLKDDSTNSKDKGNESNSSIDSDDEYGPSIPIHLKGRNQMITQPKKLSVIPKVSEIDTDKKWKEKHNLKKKHKHKEKHKHKKEKKKKKNKDHKHKKHSKKCKKRRSSSSSSSSDSSVEILD